MIVLSVDPSASKTGYVVADVFEEKVDLLEYGTINLKGKKNHLEILYRELEEKIKNFQVDTVLLETPFYSINAQTLIKLGEVRGVVILLTQIYKLKLFQYTPAEVKISVTGYGRSSKEEVINMVNRLFDLNLDDSDIADALAILYCHTLKRIEV
ncbi:MAG: crossover junction endodeoxyribonuclease [Sulfurihydrogenibium sp.]|nr:MAG: crossover junction endodeoxyribonuclease [Sulfurihydrogenibium sp.]